MSVRQIARWIATLSCALLIPLAAQAQEDDGEEGPRVVSEIHSALPLYTFDWEKFWPRSFHEQNRFGCRSRVNFGDWQFTPTNKNMAQPSWLRFRNYGVFHCAGIISYAGERGELDDPQNDFEYGFFAVIDTITIDDADWELWVIQEGTRTGSDYTLMTRKASEERIDSFQILQQICPQDKILEAKNMDVWRTAYCAINSQEDLVSLAREMALLPHAGILTRIPEPEQSNPG